MKNKPIMFSLFFTLVVFMTQSFVVTPVKEASNKKAFLEFLSHFELKELPFAMNMEDYKKNYQKMEAELSATAQKKSKKHSASLGSINAVARPFIGEVKSMFSRMGPPDIFPVARFYIDKQSIAVVYLSKRRFGGENNHHYRLQLFDLDGNTIPLQDDELNHTFNAFTLGQVSYYQNITFRLDDKGRIWQNRYEPVNKKMMSKKAFSNEQKLKETVVFQVVGKKGIHKLDHIPTDARAGL